MDQKFANNDTSSFIYHTLLEKVLKGYHRWFWETKTPKHFLETQNIIFELWPRLMVVTT